MRAPRGISFKDKIRHLYERGYSIATICTLCRVSRGMALDILAHNGYPDAAEVHPSPIDEPAEAPRKVRIVPTDYEPAFDKARPVAARVDSQERRWCTQCERNVLVAEARACGSPFCKAKEQAA